MNPNKLLLLDAGITRLVHFCNMNRLSVPTIVRVNSEDWKFDKCAYYRPGIIKICLERCAAIGVAGPAWSYPGYIVDRTPFGVLQHELGHHVDVIKSGVTVGYMGNFSQNMRKETGEAPITSYCPNDGEWFAEMFRLFVTNPNLLMLVRPKTYYRLREIFQPVERRFYYAVMKDAPERTKAACEKRILKGI